MGGDPYVSNSNLFGRQRRTRSRTLKTLAPRGGMKRLLFMVAPVCGICGETIESLDKATIDHIRPLSRGGENHWVNKQLAHAKCNQLKGNTWED